jgi:hypothetical protein
MKAIAAAFDLRGNMISAEPYGSGHINDTYKVVVDQGGLEVNYILQRVNQNVFPNVEKLMENIQRVTAHLGKKIIERGGNPTRETLTLVPTVDGKSYYRDAEGGCWRAYIFIYGARTYDFVSDTKQAFEAASAFGSFQKQLADLPGGPVFESIPNFHNTPKRFENFLNSLKADKLNRAASAKKEIDFCLARQDKIGAVVKGLADGSIPTRVTHNDTKINNIMIDDATGAGLCVIDLDTVMPGSVLYDFGDQVRTATATAAEDERDLSKVNFRLDFFEALANGYLESASGFLVPGERNYLAQSGALITFEIGLRFLTDFLDGDIYFKVHRDGHNLDRCRTQFEMTRQMDEQIDRMAAIVDKQ